MNKVIEAVGHDGSHGLVPDTLIKGYADEAKLVANGNIRRATRILGQMLANFMYVRKYKTLTEIRYDADGNQRRTVIIQAS